ncbi:MAG: family N-acetyltransferase [Flavipsychrobacter sp.]|nr:family N-acetyltransferase [Flavipsychrobacter sp.]
MPELFETFPVLHTSRLDLIEITPAHRVDLFRIFTDERVTKYYDVLPLNEESDAQKIMDILAQRYQNKTGIRWGIALKGHKEIIGNLGFNTFTPGHRSTIGYSIEPEYWNKGLITEAIQEIVRYGFNELGVNRIEAEVMPGNTASEKVLDKLGFLHEGLLRQWMYWNGKYNDINMYALLKRDIL